MSEKEQEKHISVVVENLANAERGPLSPKQVQLLHYMATIGAADARLAGLLSMHDVLMVLARQVKDTQQMEVWELVVICW